MFLNRFAVFLLVTITELVLAQVVSYCGRSLCKGTEYEHITCSATGDLLQSCSEDARAVTLTDENIQQILTLHNQYRNKLASGKEPGYSTAARMTTMVR